MNKILAIRFGIGYWLISPPYNDDSCFKFKRAEYLPANAVIIIKNEPNELLVNISYTKKIGMMALTIKNNTVSIKTNITGATSRGKLTNVDTNQRMPTKYTYLNIIVALNTIFNKDHANIKEAELKQYIIIIKQLCYQISDITNMRARQIWNGLFDYNTRAEGKLQYKLKILSHYGNGSAKCVKCGNSDIRVLSIDHINGGGNKHVRQLRRYGSTLYRWLVDNKYPEGYQTLCMNCQWVKKSECNEQ